MSRPITKEELQAGIDAVARIPQEMFDLLMQPGATFIQFAHDDDCPGASGDPNNCVCTPDIVVHRDEKRFIEAEVKSRQHRRAAARAAAKALQKAGGGK